MIEEIKDKTNERIVRELVEIDSVMEGLKADIEERKAELKKRDFKDTICVPDFGKKVAFAKGKKSTSYDVMGIYSDMIKEGVMVEFPKIVKINKKQVEEIEDVKTKNIINSILLKKEKVSFGESTISIVKMNKTELKEHTKIGD